MRFYFQLLTMASSDEPGHKAMLYFLEVLMNSNEALTISQLAGRFGSRSFTAEMRAACGANESGLKKFLLKYPSLFTVRGNMVSLYDGKGGGDELPPREGSPASSTSSSRGLPDVSIEMDAVQFFQGKLAKKEERWVQIRSLAGHISQASAEVRNVVGPQLEFHKWLVRHPHIFEVQGELVGLRDGIAAITQRHSGIFDISVNGSSATSKLTPPKTPPASRRAPPKTPPSLRRSHSFSEKRALQQQAQAQQTFNKFQTVELPAEEPKKSSNAPVTMTANEYKAVMYLKEILEKRGGIKLHNVTGHFSQASDGVRSTIGWTKPQLQDFISKHSGVFSITEDETVILNKNAKINVIVTGSKTPPVTPVPSGRTLTDRKGKIFHVAKLWGIIDLGKHEHVFFDKSIMRRSMEDLQKEFHVGETLHFNAIMAPKSSRAKWKATHVWRDHESEPTDEVFSDTSSTDMGMLSPSMSIEEEINQFLPNNDDRGKFDRNSSFSDAAPSGAGVVPIWNNFEDDDDANLSMVSESYQMSSSTLGDVPHMVPKAPSPAMENGLDKNKVRFIETSPAGKAVTSVACQTIATGDIIATQLYQEQ
jgi:exonuclease 3'-5' domain-containing protein 1